MQVSPNLRTDLPPVDSEAFVSSWTDACETFEYVQALSIPCCMNLATRRMLFEVIRSMHAKSVLDIGTYVGVSALNYAMAVGLGGDVTTVDVKDANASDGFWATTGRPCPPIEMLLKAGVSHRVEFVTMDSVEFMQHPPRKYDLISIDGWHEDQQVYREIELAMDLLNPNGLIFMDDVHPFNDPRRPEGLDYIDGPHKAIMRHLGEGAALRVVHIEQTFAAWAGVAFLLRKL